MIGVKLIGNVSKPRNMNGKAVGSFLALNERDLTEMSSLHPRTMYIPMSDMKAWKDLIIIQVRVTTCVTSRKGEAIRAMV